VVATLAVDGTYYIRIELNSGLAVRSSAADLTISDAPVWTTGSGTLGTIAGDFSGAVATVAATGDTVTYSEVSGTGLTGAGNANCSLNSSTGAITTTDFGGSSTSSTTYNFTIRATDAQAQTADRAFSLTSSFTYTVDWLIVAGGGGAAQAGGGAGGFRAGASLDLTPANVYTVTVGDGGAGTASDVTGTSGDDSILSGTGITTVTSTGGGGGGAVASGTSANGLDGGSGGGEGFGRRGSVSPVNTVGAGNTPAITPITGETTTVQGFAGGLGYSDLATYTGSGPGGGASEVGADNVNNVCGDGGDGSANSITGASVTYAGGGGGAIGSGTGTAGSGGTGGGGAGNTSGGGTAGTANLGGGGGGSSSTGGSGGKGVVILRMADADYSGTTTGSPTIDTSTVADETIIIFNSDGSYTA